KMFVCESTQTTGRADPNAALAVYGQRNNPIVRQAITRCIGKEPSALELIQAIGCADPYAAVLVLIDREYAVIGQAILHRVPGDCSAFVASQTLGRTNPERTFSIFKQSLNAIFGKFQTIVEGSDDAVAEVHHSGSGCHPKRVVVVVA